MAIGWDRIVSEYERSLPFLPETLPSSQHPNWIGHIHGMLSAIPVLRSDPFLATYKPPPHTTHFTFTFCTENWKKRVEIWFDAADEKYIVRFVDDAETLSEHKVNLQELTQATVHYIEQFLK